MSNTNAFSLFGAAAIMAVGLSLFLLGCQPSPSANKSTTTLTVWTLQMRDFSDEMQRVFKGFEATHPGVKVDWVDVPFNEGEKKTLAAILSGHPPDVINLNPEFSAILAGKKALIDLHTQLSTAELNEYTPVALQAATVADTNYLYGLPWYLTSAVTFYNKRLLNNIGWWRPALNTDELETLAKKLKAKNKGYALLPVLGQNGRFLKWLFQIGVPITNAHGHLRLNSPEAVAALTYWQNLYNQGYIPKSAVNASNQDAVERYQAGQTAMLVAGGSVLRLIQDNAPQVYRATLVTSQFPKRSVDSASKHFSAVDFSSMVLVVPKQTQHPKLATQLAVWMSNTENTLRLAQLAPVLPPTKAALKNDFFIPERCEDLACETRKISAKQLLNSNKAFPTVTGQKQINQAVDYAVQAVLLGKQTPQQALNQAQQVADSY